MKIRSLLTAAAIVSAATIPAAVSAQESMTTIDDIMSEVMASVEASGIQPGVQGVFITDATMINSTGVDIGSNGGASAADADQQGAAMASTQ